jgi:hypothetical protein
VRSTWVVYEIVWIEEEVEVLGGLGQEKALHPVLQGVGPYILNIISKPLSFYLKMFKT